MLITDYDREKAVAYARRWAKERNPAYYDYSRLGGDCTNFASQCIYAGSGVMNYKETTGWYYIGANNHSPSWTGVPYLYDFLVRKSGVGPFGREAGIREIEPGDISQFQNATGRYSHTQVILSIGKQPSMENILIAAHSIDSLDRALSTYVYRKMRFIHIEGVRIQK